MTTDREASSTNNFGPGTEDEGVDDNLVGTVEVVGDVTLALETGDEAEYTMHKLVEVVTTVVVGVVIAGDRTTGATVGYTEQ